jgi:hypothetical protein
MTCTPHSRSQSSPPRNVRDSQSMTCTPHSRSQRRRDGRVAVGAPPGLRSGMPRLRRALTGQHAARAGCVLSRRRRPTRRRAHSRWGCRPPAVRSAPRGPRCRACGCVHEM